MSSGLFAGTPDSALSDYNMLPGSVSYPGSAHDPYESNLAHDISLGTFLPQGNSQTYTPLNSFPAFFEQVMLPGLDSEDVFQETQQPRVFDFMHDNDFALSDNDLFGTEFIPDLDRILDTMAPFPELEDQQQSPQDDQDSARRRAAAFQRSLWSVYLAYGYSWSANPLVAGCGYRKRINTLSATKGRFP